MLCFKDKTFCSQSIDNKCVNTECSLLLTKQLKQEAYAWWNENRETKEEPPIAYSDYKNTEYCLGFIEPTDSTNK